MRDHFLNLFKLVFALLLLPFTAIVTISFIKSLSGLTHTEGHLFWLGVLIYTIVHIFIYEPQGIYRFGQKLTASLLGFYPPLASVGSRILPIYTLLGLIIFYFLYLFHKKIGYEIYFMFLTGFTLTLHIVLTAKELRQEGKRPFSPNYIFCIQLIYIFIIFLISMMFSFIVPKFYFSSFFYSVIESIKDFYTAIFHQLFIP